MPASLEASLGELLILDLSSCVFQFVRRRACGEDKIANLAACLELVSREYRTSTRTLRFSEKNFGPTSRQYGSVKELVFVPLVVSISSTITALSLGRDSRYLSGPGFVDCCYALHTGL